MSNVTTPCRYDFVGSFLRPARLKKARRSFDEGKVSYEELKGRRSCDHRADRKDKGARLSCDHGWRVPSCNMAS